MECGNGVGITTYNANTNNIPHYLLPFTGSCHDICKYGRRRPLQEEQENCKPIIYKKRSAKLISNKTNSQREETKSISLKARTQNTSEKALALAAKMPVQRWDGKRRRKNNDDVHYSVKNTKNIWIPVGAASGSSKGSKTGKKELLSTQKEQKRVKRESSIPLPPPNSSSFQEEDEKIAQMEIDKEETERSKFVTENTPPPSSSSSSSSCYGEEDGESDKLIVSRRKRNRHKIRKKNEVIKPDSRATKLKFRIRNSIHLHQENNNVPRRHKYRRTRVEGANLDDSVSNNRAIRIPSLKTLTSKDKSCSSKSRRRRVRYGKTRILVLEKREGDGRRNKQENDTTCSELLLSKKKQQLHHHDLQMQRKRDVQVLFNNVMEETVSKLAERRKGTVKSLVGAFETLISLQARQRFFHVAATARVSC